MIRARGKASERTCVGFAAVAMVRQDVAVGTRAGVRSESIATNLRARFLFDTLVDISAQVRIFRVHFETAIALALVTNRLVDAHVCTRINRQTFVHVYTKSKEK